MTLSPISVGLTAAPAGDPGSWAALARGAEAAGFTTLHIPDHVIDELIAPAPALMAAAAATATLRVGTLVANNELRHPVLLARDLHAVHVLSGGRVEIGIGAGHARKEHEALGVPFRDPAVRVARLAEAVAVIRELVDGATVDHDGEHYRVHDLRLPPTDDVRMRVLVGGNGFGVHRIGARFADTVQITGFTSGPDGRPDMRWFGREAAEAHIARLRGLMADAGRTPQVGVLVQVVRRTDDRRAAVRGLLDHWGDGVDRALRVADRTAAEELLLGSPYLLIGTAAQMAEQIREQASTLGVTQLSVFANRPDSDAGVDALAPVIELLA